ncbi:MAG TPA: hypothetical protein VKW08_16855 [Xanthobacteraceae bacterium]|jgi:hypothetical protein|nr:hypothetical protein [Xanthobacteraceae bacterium]
MANREQRNNREKKKPKAEKNKIKSQTPASLFSAPRNPPATSPAPAQAAKKNP